jgi:hypothetical protein
MDFLKADRIRPWRFFFGNLESRKSVCDLLEIDPAQIKNIPPAA